MLLYILCFRKHKYFVVVHFLADFFTFAKLVFNHVISDIHQHMSWCSTLAKLCIFVVFFRPWKACFQSWHDSYSSTHILMFNFGQSNTCVTTLCYTFFQFLHIFLQNLHNSQFHMPVMLHIFFNSCTFFQNLHIYQFHMPV